jgi:hypothetical protein
VLVPVARVREGVVPARIHEQQFLLGLALGEVPVHDRKRDQRLPVVPDRVVRAEEPLRGVAELKPVSRERDEHGVVWPATRECPFQRPPNRLGRRPSPARAAGQQRHIFRPIPTGDENVAEAGHVVGRAGQGAEFRTGPVIRNADEQGNPSAR